MLNSNTLYIYIYACQFWPLWRDAFRACLQKGIFFFFPLLWLSFLLNNCVCKFVSKWNVPVPPIDFLFSHLVSMPESAFLRDYLFQMAVVDSLSFDFSINTPPGSILNTFLSQLSAISFFVLPVLVFWYSCFLIVERRTIPLRRTLSHRWLVSTWLLSWERTVSATWKLQTGIRRGSSSFRFTEYHLGDSMAVSVGGMKLRRERRRECCRPAQLPTDAVWLRMVHASSGISKPRGCSVPVSAAVYGGGLQGSTALPASFLRQVSGFVSTQEQLGQAVMCEWETG